MNPIPVVVTAAVVVAVPPIRRRVVPVLGATADAGLRTAGGVAVGTLVAATAAYRGVSGIVSAVVRAPQAAPSEG